MQHAIKKSPGKLVLFDMMSEEIQLTGKSRGGIKRSSVSNSQKTFGVWWGRMFYTE